MQLSRLFIILPLLIFIGCYSFTGASVPPHLKTIALPLFDDQSGSGEPGLREKLTNKLIEKFQQDNSLEVSDKNSADCIIEGTITAMLSQPQVVSKGEIVSKTRLTINVKVIYQDLKLKKKIYDKQISGWSEYELTSDPALRNKAIDEAIDKVVEDILLNTVSGW
ncbi:MAG: LptE family protein [Ignavibacteriales bacterium]|nr:LptE family protein [Ignavibacteriales bacterium]